MKMWKVNVLTLFPEMFPGPLGYSVIGRGLEEKIWGLNTVNIRDFATDKHQTVDDTPCGGGVGMLLRPDIIDSALKHTLDDTKGKIIYLSPRGEQFTHKMAHELCNEDNITLLCGRFEGIDQRVLDKWGVIEVSIGDFILAGGEIAAMALIESCVRLLPGVLGDPQSTEIESFSHNLLEYPQYTKPVNWDGNLVPEVLLSGHHKKISSWRLMKAEEITAQRRPDLWQKYLVEKGKGLSHGHNEKD